MPVRRANDNSRVTAKDIAQAAGVSQATVSMALRGSSEISEARIAHIRAIANKMNYHPRAAAQLLRSKRAGQVGVVVASSSALTAFSQDFTGPMLGSFVDACISRDLRYVIDFHADDQSAAELRAPYQVTSGLVDGTIVIGDVGDPLRKLLAKGFPHHPWVSIEEPGKHCVLADSRGGISRMIEMVVGLGHRQLAYVCGPQKYYTHHEGFLGWEESTRRFGLRIPPGRHFVFGASEHTGIGAAEAVEWIRDLLQQKNRPTAFICQDMVIARAVIQVATELDLAIPRDLSVTSWGWHVTAQEQYPALATMELNYRAMIDHGVEMLNRLIDGEPVDEARLIMPLNYVAGATVGPAPVET